MAGTLIALESTNMQLLDKTAKYLSLKLQSEGHSVEVMNFPRQKQTSSYYVETHQKGEYGDVSPYAASMFYILDRYGAAPQIRQLLESGTIIICKGFRGTSLATLGAAIQDSSMRKGFYIWADSLESGTFSVPRPDMSIVLSEELPTLYELCELFPKDYVFAIDATKVRNMLNTLIPPAPAIHKAAKEQPASSWFNALVASGQGAELSYLPILNYLTAVGSKKYPQAYTEGLRDLVLLKNEIIEAAPDHSVLIGELLSPLGSLVQADLGQPTNASKNAALKALLTKNFESHYGEAESGVRVAAATPVSELADVGFLLTTKVELGPHQTQDIYESLPISEKINLYKAYIAGIDADPQAYPLNTMSLRLTGRLAYSDIATLKRLAPTLKFSLQSPSPRWGYDVPAVLSRQIDAIENCFMLSLKLYDELCTAGSHQAAEEVVLQGHFAVVALELDGHAVRALARSKDALAGEPLQIVAEACAQKFPILWEV